MTKGRGNNVGGGTIIAKGGYGGGKPGEGGRHGAKVETWNMQEDKQGQFN